MVDEITPSLGGLLAALGRMSSPVEMCKKAQRVADHDYACAAIAALRSMLIDARLRLLGMPTVGAMECVRRIDAALEE